MRRMYAEIDWRNNASLLAIGAQATAFQTPILVTDDAELAARDEAIAREVWLVSRSPWSKYQFEAYWQQREGRGK